MAAVRAVFGDDDDGTEAEGAVGGQLDGMRLDRRGPGLVEAVGVISVVHDKEEEKGKGDEEGEWAFA